jgi:hypothetical protein
VSGEAVPCPGVVVRVGGAGGRTGVWWAGMVVNDERPPRWVGAVRCWCVSGGVLLSHTVSRAVPSALKGLTSGFGMGPGVSPSLRPPERLCSTPTRGGVEVPERDRSIQLYRHLIIPPHPAPVSGVVCGSPAAPPFLVLGGVVWLWVGNRTGTRATALRFA